MSCIGFFFFFFVNVEMVESYTNGSVTVYVMF